MEGQEELVVSSDYHQTQMIIKGKRTKRQRPMSPFGLAGTSSSSSACGGTQGGGEEYGNSFTSASYESTEEEEDMANCLILLAQGCDVVPKQTSSTVEATAISTHVGRAGFYVYECKTCNRTFPSFQALGGHRASHKKPKSAAALADQDKKSAPTHFISASMDQEQEDSKQFVKKSSPPPPAYTVPIQMKGFQSNNNNKAKIHECSICGSEFTSGQALGGHMRRHRAAVASNNSTTTSAQVVGMSAAIDNSTTRSKQERNILALDLNLPAPEDHDHHHHHHHQQHQIHQIHHQRDSKFQFVPTQQTSLVFNAPALVDCHY